MTKRGFTLVELLVVVGIMATLATVSIGSYFAVVRGMADRGAIAGATSVISLALERARIDMSPTVVYFYNELVQQEDSAKGKDLIAAGVAIAVRRAGRITRVNGNKLCDEFADLERTYGIAENSGSMRGDTFRLYKFNFSGMKYSSVYSEAVEDEINGEEFLVERPVDRGFTKPGGGSEKVSAILTFAFVEKSSSGSPNWQAGDAYGYEFARIRLPDNYIFGTDVPTQSQPIKELNALTLKCYPSSEASSLQTVQITARRPNGWKKVGDTKSEMKDI